MNTGLNAAWAFIKAFWPFAIVIALAFIVLFQRNEIQKRDTKIAGIEASLQAARDANAHNVKVIDEYRAGRAANDNIILDLLEKQRTSGQLEIQTTERIKEVIRDDPASKDWADMPVPDGLRNTVNKAGN